MPDATLPYELLQYTLDNAIFGDIIDAYFLINTKLMKLHFNVWSNEIKDVTTIGQGLGKSDTHSIRFNLRNKQIKDVTAIGQGLGKSNALSIIFDLGNNQIQDVTEIGQGLGKSNALSIIFDLGNNQIQDVTAIRQGLENSNAHSTTFNLGNNQIQDEDITDLLTQANCLCSIITSNKNINNYLPFTKTHLKDPGMNLEGYPLLCILNNDGLSILTEYAPKAMATIVQDQRMVLRNKKEVLKKQQFVSTMKTGAYLIQNYKFIGNVISDVAGLGGGDYKFIDLDSNFTKTVMSFGHAAFSVADAYYSNGAPLPIVNSVLFSMINFDVLHTENALVQCSIDVAKSVIPSLVIFDGFGASVNAGLAVGKCAADYFDLDVASSLIDVAHSVTNIMTPSNGRGDVIKSIEVVKLFYTGLEFYNSYNDYCVEGDIA